MMKDLLLAEIKANKITDKNTIAMILAQCQVESDNFKRLEESFAYRATTLCSVFGKYFPDIDSANKALLKGKEHIANTVYANRMGNGSYASGDGYKYHGRGLIQLTGKDNYTAFMLACNIDTLNNPDLLLLPENAVKSALWFLTNRQGFMAAAKNGDVKECTRLINGGFNGINERIQAYAENLKSLNGG